MLTVGAITVERVARHHVVAAPTVSAGPPAAPVKPLPLSPEAADSDAFDDWSSGGSDPAARFLASDTAHDGSSSLLLTRPATDAAGLTASLVQPVSVSTDAPMHLRFWAKAQSAEAGSLTAQISSTTTVSLPLPAGTYDWTQFTLAYTVPKGVKRVEIRFVSGAPTTSTWIDDATVQGYGSTGVVLRNPGFEHSSADLSITDPSLVLTTGDAVLHLRSRRSPSGRFTWSLTSMSGAKAAEGTGDIEDGAATVRLKAPQGYYTFSITATLAQVTAQRSTNLVIFDAPPAIAPGDSFTGVGVHLGGESDQVLAQKLADLVAIGVRYVRTDATWGQIEAAPGVFTLPVDLDREVAAMQKVGIRPLLIPDYSNPLYDGGVTPSSPAGIAAYARFAAAVAAHYPQADIDVYNEFDFRFNKGRCGTTPQCYLQLLRPAAAAIRAASPQAAIGAPSTAGIGVNADWLDGFVGGGGLADLSAISLHPYVQPAAPESLGADLAALNQKVAAAHGGVPIPIWFSEFGYSTVPGWVNERHQAAYLVRSELVGLEHGMTRFYWYDAVDDSPIQLDLESNFGLFRRPTSFAPAAAVPKPAAAAMGIAARRLTMSSPPAVTKIGTDGIQTVQLGKGSTAVTVVFSTGAAHRVTISGGGAVTSMTGERIDLRSDGTVRVGDDPIYIGGTPRIVLA
ncbi:hypothetical protein [uncultured Amnibacterium sp.]|uniref:hypothetical protein n=1 Tax=uncultured Amnibacterium sp. TaxID=1631851 RepID=UPI0035CAA972